MDSATILAQWATTGEEKLFDILRSMNEVLLSIDSTLKRTQLTLEAFNIAEEKTVISTKKFATELTAAEAAIKQNAAEMNKAHIEALKMNSAIDKQAASAQRAASSIALLHAEMNSTPLGRFTVQIAGGVDKLKALETSAYQASRASTLMSQMLVTHPIQTLKAFAASAEKAAIMADYFRQQLAFVAASRFGTIIIFSAIFGSIEESIRKAMQAATEFDTAMRKISRYIAAEGFSSEVATKQATELTKQIQQLSLHIGVALPDLGAMAELLKSAGLEMQTVKDVIGTFAQFKVAYPEVETRNFTKALIGLLNATREMKGFKELGSDAERLKKLMNELAIASASAVYEPRDIPTFLSHLTSIATVMGILPEEMLAFQATLTSVGIKAQTAGRLMRGLEVTLSQAKNIEALEKMGVYIDKTQTLGSQLKDIFTQLVKISGVDTSGAINVQGMEEFSKLIPAERLSIFAALLKEANNGWKEYDKQLAKINNSQGAVTRAATEMNNGLEAQKAILLNVLSAIGQNITSGQGLADLYAGLATSAKMIAVPLLTLVEGFKQLGIVAFGSVVTLVGVLDAIGKASVGDFEGAKLAVSTIGTTIEDTFSRMLQSGKAYEDTITGFFVNPLAKVEEQQKQIATATDNASKSIKAQVLYFSELVTDEEKYRLGLSAQGEILSAHIEKAKELARTTAEEAVRQANINEKSEEYTKAKEKALVAQEKLNALLQKQKEAEIANVDSVGKFIAKLEGLKTFSPAEQIANNNKLFAEATVKLAQTKVGTEGWRKAMDSVADATKGVISNVKIVEESINKAKEATDKFATAQLDFLLSGNWQDKQKAEEILSDMKFQAEMAKIIAKSAEDRLVADNQILNVLKKQKEVQFYGFNEQQNAQEIRDITGDIVNTMGLIAEQRTKEAEAAKREADITGTTQSKTAQINSDIQSIITNLDNAYKSLDGGLNTGLDSTSTKLTDITNQIIALRNLIENMPELKVGGDQDLKQALEEANRRG